MLVCLVYNVSGSGTRTPSLIRGQSLTLPFLIFLETGNVKSDVDEERKAGDTQDVPDFIKKM